MKIYQRLEQFGVISAARSIVPHWGRLAFRALRRSLDVQLAIVLPGKGWGTKGFEFWTFLSLLLIRSNCLRILELGSGRSTITFAEYASFRKAQFISVETSRKWFNKARWELRCLGLSDDPVRLLKWESGGTWYDLEQFRSITPNEGDFEFLFIDGPNHGDGDSRGIRDREVAIREIRRCAANADIVVVDDVHRRHILDTVDRILIDPKRYDKWFYDYSVVKAYSNTLCICVKKGSRASAELGGIQSTLELRFNVTLEREECPQD